MKNFCRASNLHALMKSDEVPETLRSNVEELMKPYEGHPHIPLNADSLGRLSTLGEREYQLLTQKLNEDSAHAAVWLSAEAWCEHKDRKYLGCVSSQCEQLKQLNLGDVCYAVVSRNPNNSVIAFRDRLVTSEMLFGQIQQIFLHHRVSPSKEKTAETFFIVRTFSTIDGHNLDCFKKLDVPDLQGHLCFESLSTLKVIRFSQVVSHCAWVIYKPQELHPKISQTTIAMVNLDRN